MRRCLFIFIACLCVQVGVAKEIATTGIPEGFEDFFEPQTTAVDVYFGGVFRVSTLATYTPETLTFDSVDEVLDKLPVKDNAVAVRVALSEPLAVNDDYVCDGGATCDTPDPDIAEIVFDESKFKVDVFINSDFLTVSSYNNLKFLPKSDTSFSYVNNLALTLNGTSGGQTQRRETNLLGQSTVASYNNHINASWMVGSEQSFKFNQLYGQHDNAGYQTRLGFLNTSNRYFDFVESQPYLGGAFGTSFNTRKDLDFISTVPIQVYIPTRSRVNIKKDDVVVSSVFYDAGNHNLDTSKLPSGAYNITIEINGLDGRSETLNRFYVKTSNLPPADLNVYYVEAGQMTEYSQNVLVPKSVDGEYFFRTALGHRLTNNIGSDVSLAYGYDDTVLESGLYYYNKHYNFRPKLMLANQSRYGVGFYGFTQFGGASISYNAQKLWDDNKQNTSTLNAQPSLLLNAGSRHSLSVNKNIFRGVASLQWSANKRDGSVSNDSFSVSYKRNIFTRARSNLDVSALLTKNDKNQIVSLGLEWRQTQNVLSHQASLTARQNEVLNAETSTDVSLLYKGQLPEQTQGSQTYSASWRALKNEDAQSVGAGGRYSNNKLRATANVEKSLGDSEGAVLYNASVATSIVGNAHSIGVGGHQAATSALVMDIEGTAHDSEFDVIINDRKKARAKVGDSVVVPVRPFETYDVKLKDVGTEFIAFDDKTVRHTLYPGNVPSIQFRADKLIVIVGTLVKNCDKTDVSLCDEPVGNARINGAHEWTATDDNGDFQIEVSPSKLATLSAQTREYSCKIKLPKFDVNEAITYFETPVICQ